MMNLDGYNRSTREFLEKYGDLPIVALSVVIVPVPFIIPLVLNLLTKREFNRCMKKRGYDRLYHWELMATIDVDGKKKNVIIQKACEIDINFDKKSYSYYYKSLINNKRFMDVPLESLKDKKDKKDINLTINEMLNKTREKIGYDDYYKWSMIGNLNCQGYVKTILESNKLYDKTELSSHYQADIDDIETDIIKNHSTSLYIMDMLSFMVFYLYKILVYIRDDIIKKKLAKFTSYYNI